MLRIANISVVVMVCLVLSVAYADESNNPNPHSGITSTGGTSVISTTSLALVGFTDHASWKIAAGSTILINFEAFADGQQITTQLQTDGISLVSGVSTHGATDQFVSASTSLTFGMFVPGTLPTEPNFLSNCTCGNIFGTGSLTFDMDGPTTAIGAFIAEGAPLDNFSIELFDGVNSLGTITVPPVALPNSFTGVVSDTPFDRAVFFAVNPNDSWGVDNLEHNGQQPLPVEAASWGAIKALYQ